MSASVYYEDSAVRLFVGDAREVLRSLSDESVQCCVTSPPYWGLRDYGHDGQLGLEPTPDEYVAKLVDVFGEVRRVLRPDGTLWLNLGDSYAGSGKGPSNGVEEGDKPYRHLSNLAGAPARWLSVPAGIKGKDLVGIPWTVAFALRKDGWYLRSDIIWHKPNPMPESVRDRPTKAHEYVFLLSKSERYYYDADAVAEVGTSPAGSRAGYAGYSNRALSMGREPSGNEKPGSYAENDGTRNRRSVWTITTKPYPDAHFATFPPELPEVCIKAGSAPGDAVLDPFAGAGTTLLTAKNLNRRGLGIELNPDYCDLACKRLAQQTLAL